MTPSLALRFDLKVDESVPSWISRLAVHNGAGTAREFCLDMGFTFQACVDGRPDALAKLSAMTGTSVEALERASIMPAGKNFVLRRERITKPMLRRSRIRVCPLCLQRDLEAGEATGEPAPYGRTLWQLSVFRACDQHGCALDEIVESARSTTHDFAWHCHDQRAAISRRAETVRSCKPSRLEGYVKDRLERRQTGAPWLDQLELDVAVATCEMFGALVTIGPKAQTAKLADAVLHEAGDLGFEAACGGEPTLRQLLASIQSKRLSASTKWEGPCGTFGFLYKSLAYARDDADFEPVRNMLRRHIIDTMPLRPGEVVLNQPVEKPVLYSIATASYLTGRSLKHTRKALAAAGLIRADHAGFDNRAVTFAAEGAQAFLAAEADNLSFADAATYLGAGRVQTELLIKSGLIKSHLAGGHKQHECYGNYARADLDDFLARLSDGAEAVDFAPKAMHAIPAAASRARCLSMDIVKLILARKLKRVAKSMDKLGYSSILVDVNEVRFHLLDGQDDVVTIAVARSILRTTLPAITTLIELGLLRSDEHRDKEFMTVYTIVCRRDVENFHARYVSISELAGTARTRYHAIRRLLVNVPPAIKLARVRAIFYERNQIPKL